MRDNRRTKFMVRLTGCIGTRKECVEMFEPIDNNRVNVRCDNCKVGVKRCRK